MFVNQADQIDGTRAARLPRPDLVNSPLRGLWFLLLWKRLILKTALWKVVGRLTKHLRILHVGVPVFKTASSLELMRRQSDGVRFPDCTHKLFPEGSIPSTPKRPASRSPPSFFPERAVHHQQATMLPGATSEISASVVLRSKARVKIELKW